MSINTEMTALADAVRAKTGLTDTLSIAEMTTAIGNIEIGGDIDLTGVTVTADKMLDGIVAVDGSGSKITGTIQTVTAAVSGDNVVVPAGFHAEAKSFPVSGGADVSGVTVTASDMLKGKIAVGSDGQQIVGSIETVTASKSGDTVTVPAGFHAEEQTFDIGGAEINLDFVTAGANDILLGKIGADKDGNPVNGTIAKATLQVFENVVTMTEGYSEGETVTIPEMTVEVTADKIIVPVGYNKMQREFELTSGGETVEYGYINADGNFQPIDLSGDAPADSGEARSVDLKMFNTGVPLPDVPANGGGASMEFYKCAAVDTSAKTWTGYKAVLIDGVYSFEETVTEGLSYSAVTPKVGTVYSADALGEVKLWTGAGNIPAGVPTDGLLAWYPLTVNANDAFGGRSDSIVNGNVDFSQGYATGFSTSNYIQLPGGIIPNGQNEWTVGFLIKKPERTGCHDWAEVKGSNEGVAFYDTSGWYHIQHLDSEWTAINEQPFNNWLLLLIANNPSTGSMVVYSNGSEARSTDSREISVNNPVTIGVLNRNGNIQSATPSVTQIKHVFFYGKALSADEVSSMYQAMANTGELDA